MKTNIENSDMPISSPTMSAPRMVTRFGFKLPLIGGMLLIAAGLLWFSQVPASGGSFAGDVLGPSLLAAAGLGFAFVPVTIAAVTGTAPGRRVPRGSTNATDSELKSGWALVRLPGSRS
jgi:hypothetical protein